MARKKKQEQVEEADVTTQANAPAQAADPVIVVDTHPGQPGIIVTRGDAILLLDEGNARGWFIDPVTRLVFDQEQLERAWAHFKPFSHHFEERDGRLVYQRDTVSLPLQNRDWRPAIVTPGEPISEAEAQGLPLAVLEEVTGHNDQEPEWAPVDEQLGLGLDDEGTPPLEPVDNPHDNGPVDNPADTL